MDKSESAQLAVNSWRTNHAIHRATSSSRGSVTVYILSGTIRSRLEQGPIETFRAGGTFFEPLGIIHTLAENVSDTESAQLLAIFVHDEGATLTTYLE